MTYFIFGGCVGAYASGSDASIVVNGNLTVPGGETTGVQLWDGAVVTVNGNVTSGETGIDARDAGTVTVSGNVTADYEGVSARTECYVTIDGTFSKESYYVSILNSDWYWYYLDPEDMTIPSCKSGYDEYSVDNAFVWVKNQAVTQHTITASAGAGSSISPSGNVIVNNGASRSVIITPNSNYSISDVKVDGTSVGTVGSYTFNNVTADHTISATFDYSYTGGSGSGSGSGGSSSGGGSGSCSGGSSGGSSTPIITSNWLGSIAKNVADKKTK